jgi:hypothetical protein
MGLFDTEKHDEEVVCKHQFGQISVPGNDDFSTLLIQTH